MPNMRFKEMLIMLRPNYNWAGQLIFKTLLEYFRKRFVFYHLILNKSFIL